MAGDLPLALRRTQRRTRQHDLDQPAKKTPAPTPTRKSSRAAGAAAAQKKPATTRAAGRAARPTKKSRAGGVQESSASVSAADDATDDSVTLVDEADESITALDFEIPISSSSNKRKRRPSVTTTTTSSSQAIKKVRRQTNHNNKNENNNNDSSIVHILPLRRQILDDHTIRRIRRNGLSAEMNDAYREKRARRQRTLEELRRAREELRDRDAEIERLRELTALFGDGSSQQLQQLRHQNHEETEMELELSRLREEVLGRRRQDDDVELTSSPPVAREVDGDDDGWGGMDGMSDAGDSDAGGDFGARDFDDEEEFGEASLAELESGGTPDQHRHRQKQKSTAKRPAALRPHGTLTLTPPSTSPTKPASSPVRQIHSSSSTASTCDAGVQAAPALKIPPTDAGSQACIPDPAVDALHEELSALRAEVGSLGEALLEREALQARAGEKLAHLRLSSAAGSSSSPPPSGQAEDQDQDRDFELQLDIVLQDLAEKTDRLGELSALLTPGGSTGHKEATAQLSAALQDVRETLSDLDPSSAPLPQSAGATITLAATTLRDLDSTLRQRTAAHEAELSALAADLAASRAEGASKTTQITNLSADIVHLAETIAALREEVDILQSASSTQQADLDSARDAALQGKTAAAEAEARLAEAGGRVAELAGRLAETEARLKGRDGELAAAGVTIAKLKSDAAREMGRSRDAVRAMRAQMMAALRVGDEFLGGGDGVAAKTEEGVDVVLGEEHARDQSDDSGLGLGEELQLV